MPLNPRILAATGAAAMVATACLPSVAATPGTEPEPERDRPGMGSMMDGTGGMGDEMMSHDTPMGMGDHMGKDGMREMHDEMMANHPDMAGMHDEMMAEHPDMAAACQEAMGN